MMEGAEGILHHKSRMRKVELIVEAGKMKKVCSVLVLWGLLVCPVLGAELISAGDTIIAIDADGPVSFSDYPGGEAPGNIADGSLGSKYLNFAGWDRYNAGFITTTGSSTVQSFRISTANDAPERDPVSYRLYGTNDAITSADNSLGLSENWTLISSGSLTLPSARETAGPIVNLTNSTVYTSYKMTFPELKSGDGGGLMQISEVDFFSGLDGTGSDLTLGSILAVQETPDSHFPSGENPGNLLDGNSNSKYLNFGKENSGFIVTPSGTAAVKGFQITTANDWVERDPASWVLYGTNDAITSGKNSQGLDENWVLIDSGTLALTDERFALSGIIGVNNDTAYASYKMLFPTLKNADATNSMQIADIQFYDIPEPATLCLLGLGCVTLMRKRRSL
jgi:hypothetical protein